MKTVIVNKNFFLKPTDGYFNHSPGSNDTSYNTSSLNSPVKQNNLQSTINDQITILQNSNQNSFKQNFNQQQTNMISNPSPNSPINGQQQQQQSGNNQRVINRNYLQIQSNNYNNKGNKSSTLTPNSFNNQPLNGIQDPKRSKSISRSLRSLFSRSTSTRGTITSVQKRDKSYDIAPYSSNYDAYSGKVISEKLTIEFSFYISDNPVFNTSIFWLVNFYSKFETHLILEPNLFV
jgi:hypothetical protein